MNTVDVDGEPVDPRELWQLFVWSWLTGSLFKYWWLHATQCDLQRLAAAGSLPSLDATRLSPHLHTLMLALAQACAIALVMLRPWMDGSDGGALVTALLAGGVLAAAWPMAVMYRAVQAVARDLGNDGPIIGPGRFIVLACTDLAPTPGWVFGLQHELNRVWARHPAYTAALEQFGSLAPAHRQQAARAERTARLRRGIMVSRSLELEGARPVAVLAVMAICTAVYALEVVFAGFSPSVAELKAMGGVTMEAVRGGEWWRAITANFLHASPQHYLGNMSATAVLGLSVERAYGTRRTLAIMAAAVPLTTAGALLVTALVNSGVSPARAIDPVGVGESGIVFALFGAAVARDPRATHGLGKVGWLLSAGGLLASFAPGVSLGGHAGGWVAGLLAGLLLRAGLDDQLVAPEPVPVVAASGDATPLSAGRASAAPPPALPVSVPVAVAAPASPRSAAAVYSQLVDGAARGTLDADESLRFADAVLELHGAGAAIGWYYHVLRLRPGFVPGHLALGAALLAALDERGVAHLEYAAGRAPIHRPAVDALIAGFERRRRMAA